MAFTADPAFSVHSSFAQTLQAFEGSDEWARTSGLGASQMALTNTPIKSSSLQDGIVNGLVAASHADVTILPGPSGFRHHFFPCATAWNDHLPAYMSPPGNPPGVVPFYPPAVVAAGMHHRQNVPLTGPRQAPTMQQVPQVTTSHNSFASAQVVPVVPGVAPSTSGCTGTDASGMPPPTPVPVMGVRERPMTTPSTSFAPLTATPSRLMWPAERAQLAHSRSWKDLQGAFNSAPFPSFTRAFGDVQFPGDEFSAADGARALQPLPKLQWRDQICAAEAEGSCTQALSMAPSHGALVGTSGLGQRRPPDVTWQNDDDDERHVRSKLESTQTAVRSEKLRSPLEGSTASQRQFWPGSSHTQKTSALQALSHRQDVTVSAVATSARPLNAGTAADAERGRRYLQSGYGPNYADQEHACGPSQAMPRPESHSWQGGAQHQQVNRQLENLHYGHNQAIASTCKPNASPLVPHPELAAAMAAAPGATMIYSTPGAQGPMWYAVQHIQQPHNMPAGAALLHIPQHGNPAQLPQQGHGGGFPPASITAYPSPFFTGPPHKQLVYPPPYAYPPPYPGCNTYGAQVGYSPYPAYSPVQSMPMSHPPQPPMLPQQPVHWQPRAGSSSFS